MVSEWAGKSNKFKFQHNLVIQKSFVIVIKYLKRMFLFLSFNKRGEHVYKDPEFQRVKWVQHFSIRK